MTAEFVDTFRASLKRCLAQPDFLNRFYDLFMASSHEVREKFQATDFTRQTQVLSDSLYLMAVAAQAEHGGGESESPAWAEMNRLAELHNRSNLDIHPGLYGLWLEHLIGAAREKDPEFTPEIEQAWRQTLSVGIEYLRSRY